MSQTEQPTRLDGVSDETPDFLHIHNKEVDVWYTYDGELLFDAELIRMLDERYAEMEDVEYAAPADTKHKIRTKDKEGCENDLREKHKEVQEEFGFFFGTQHLFNPYHGITEEGPRKSVAKASYHQGQHAGLGGAEYKKNKLLVPVREYEQWVYHNRVWLPVVEEYAEEYPY